MAAVSAFVPADTGYRMSAYRNSLLFSPDCLAMPLLPRRLLGMIEISSNYAHLSDNMRSKDNEAKAAKEALFAPNSCQYKKSNVSKCHYHYRPVS